MLNIHKLVVKTTGVTILNGIDLKIAAGEIHVLMGPNGSGKSTLAKVLMGHPDYEVESGHMEFAGEELNKLTPDKRARLGLFSVMQYPTEIPGVNFRNYLRLAYNCSRSKTEQLAVFKFRQLLAEKAKLLDIDPALLERNLNEGLSGGEKKKLEILQLAILEPKLAILDETDSGLDIDALKTVFSAIAQIKKAKPEMSILLITHYHKVFDYITPDFVHIIKQGKIVKTGGKELIQEINTYGYRN